MSILEIMLGHKKNKIRIVMNSYLSIYYPEIEISILQIL